MASSEEWIKFNNWNEETAVVAESDSIVWVGTSGGLIRWNVVTHNYETYDETNGLNYSSITSLAIDSKQQLWIGTTQGLVKYSKGIFTFFNHVNSSLPDAIITNIVIDGQDKIYAGTDAYIESNSWKNCGFVVYDGSTWKSITLPVDGWIGPLWSIISYRDTIYVCCGYTKMYIYTENGIEDAPGWPTDHNAISFAVDFQDSLWALSESSLSHGRQILKYSGNLWKVVYENPYGTSIWNDPRGGLWIYPDRFDIKTLKMNSAKGLPDLSSHFAINANNQFFATRWGLVKFDGSSFQSFITPKTLLSNTVYSLGTSPSGEIYLSAEMAIQKTNGLTWDSIGGQGWIDPEVKFKPDGSFWHIGIDGQYATGLDYDGSDALWTAYGSIKTQNSSGITEWRPKDLGMQRPPEYFSPQFMDIAVDHNENIWATGWYNGTVMYDRTQWHLYYSNDTLLPNGEYDRVFADSKNRIWFGTNQSSPNYGFTVLENGQWKTYYSPLQYQISYVYQIAEDHLGNIWLATGGGLLKYDGESFTLFDNSNSRLRSNTVYAVTADLRNNIWIGTNSGLYVYNPSGVSLDPYSNASPIDSFSVISSGLFVSARFIPRSFSSSSAKFELQRGRSVRKFWTVASSDFLQTCCSPIELQDTTAIIGNYYYRIKRIEIDGNTSFSPAVSFSGGKTQIHLLDANWYFSDLHIIFRWKTDNEYFVNGFELLRNDTLKAYLPSHSPKNIDGYYTLEGDSLNSSSTELHYILRAVFSDSTRSVLQTFTVTPEIPSDFKVFNNFPNPFNGITSIKFFLPKTDRVTIQFFDLLGKEVLSPVIGDFSEGYHRVRIDFRNMASGIYLYRAKTNAKSVTGKILLIK